MGVNKDLLKKIKEASKKQKSKSHSQEKWVQVHVRGERIERNL